MSGAVKSTSSECAWLKDHDHLERVRITKAKQGFLVSISLCELPGQRRAPFRRSYAKASCRETSHTSSDRTCASADSCWKISQEGRDVELSNGPFLSMCTPGHRIRADLRVGRTDGICKRRSQKGARYHKSDQRKQLHHRAWGASWPQTLLAINFHLRSGSYSRRTSTRLPYPAGRFTSTSEQFRRAVKRRWPEFWGTKSHTW